MSVETKKAIKHELTQLIVLLIISALGAIVSLHPYAFGLLGLVTLIFKLDKIYNLLNQ